MFARRKDRSGVVEVQFDINWSPQILRSHIAGRLRAHGRNAAADRFLDCSRGKDYEGIMMCAEQCVNFS